MIALNYATCINAIDGGNNLLEICDYDGHLTKFLVIQRGETSGKSVLLSFDDTKAIYEFLGQYLARLNGELD